MADTSQLPDEDGARKSKRFVIGLIVLIVIGTVIWSTVEYTADILVDRGESKKFAAVYEKDCQSRYEPDICRRAAAAHHVTCFQEATSSNSVSQGGVTYSQKEFLACMQAAEEALLLKSM